MVCIGIVQVVKLKGCQTCCRWKAESWVIPQIISYILHLICKILKLRLLTLILDILDIFKNILYVLDILEMSKISKNSPKFFMCFNV